MSSNDAICLQWDDESVSENGLCITGTRLMQWSHDMGVPKRIRMVDSFVQGALVKPTLYAIVQGIKESKVNTTQFLP